jgi:hypothetical protein
MLDDVEAGRTNYLKLRRISREGGEGSEAGEGSIEIAIGVPEEWLSIFAVFASFVLFARYICCEVGYI